MTSWSIPRESAELVGPITVTDGGEPVTTFELAVLPRNTRPASQHWKAPLVVAGGRYVLVGPDTDTSLVPGSYVIWGRYTAAPEVPVFTVGQLVIT